MRTALLIVAALAMAIVAVPAPAGAVCDPTFSELVGYCTTPCGYANDVIRSLIGVEGPLMCPLA